MERIIFKSRISVLMIAFLLTIFSPIYILSFRNRIFLYILSGVLLCIISSYCGLRYIISNNKLYLKLFWNMPFGSVNIMDIISVERTYIQFSSGAGSLKRLRINYKKSFVWFVLISPVHEQEFLDILKKLNPDIHIRVSDIKTRWRIWDWDI